MHQIKAAIDTTYTGGFGIQIFGDVIENTNLSSTGSHVGTSSGLSPSMICRGNTSDDVLISGVKASINCETTGGVDASHVRFIPGSYTVDSEIQLKSVANTAVARIHKSSTDSQYVMTLGDYTNYCLKLGHAVSTFGSPINIPGVFYRKGNHEWRIDMDPVSGSLSCSFRSGPTEQYTGRAYIQPNSYNWTRMNFTGQHRCVCTMDIAIIDRYIGMLVSSTGEYDSVVEDGDDTSSTRITINEAQPVVELTSRQKCKRVYGVISSIETGEKRVYQAFFFNVINGEIGRRRLFINGLGEGAMWIVRVQRTP